MPPVFLLRRMVLALTLGWAFAAQAQDAPSVGTGGMRLLVVEQEGCVYCAQFHREIAPAYNASPESLIAPLQSVNILGPWPEGVQLSPAPFVTPTFVLIDASGHEIGRITGYPGDIFFWSLLEEILGSAPQNTESVSLGG